MQKQLEIYVDGSYLKGQVGGGWAAFINDDYIDFIDSKLFHTVILQPAYLKIGGLNLVSQKYFVYDDWSGSRNVAGEAEAMIDALKWYIDIFCDWSGYTDFDCKIFYDYIGLSKWLDGSWKARSRIAKWYKRKYERRVAGSSWGSDVELVKVKGHSGNIWHDYVDKETRDALRSWHDGEWDGE